MINAAGRTAIGFFSDLGDVFLFFREAAAVWADSLVSLVKKRAAPGHSYQGKLLMDQMMNIGVKSIPVSVITLASTGAVFALEIGQSLTDKLGAPFNLGRIVTPAVIRELGPVLTGLMVAARNGSAIAAELGSMKVTEQVDALKCLGTSPASQLVAPRLMALVLVMPILAFFSDVVGIFGGYLVATLKLGVSSNAYVTDVLSATPGDLLYGLFKTLFFGMIIAVAACHRGLATRGGAEGVGKSCISAVVVSCMAILITDYMLTTVLF